MIDLDYLKMYQKCTRIAKNIQFCNVIKAKHILYRHPDPRPTQFCGVCNNNLKQYSTLCDCATQTKEYLCRSNIVPATRLVLHIYIRTLMLGILTKYFVCECGDRRHPHTHTKCDSSLARATNVWRRPNAFHVREI